MHISRPPIQRTNTLSSTTAIQDWERERVLMIAQLQQFREQMDYVEKKAAADKETYYQQRTSLLKQIKLKDTQLEKRMLSIQAEHESQIKLLEKQREQDKQEYQDALDDLRSRYERILQTEQQKHQRRISGFEQRLTAKQQDNYARQTQSAPSSPTRSHYDVMGSNDPEEAINSLRKRLTDLQINYDQEKRTWQTEKEKLLKRCTSRRAIEAYDDDAAAAATATTTDESKRIQKAYIQGAQAFYEERVRKLEANTKIKIDALTAKHQAEMDEVKQRFLREAQEVAMHTEARIHNLVSEHEQVIAELREEQDVLIIEHQAAMDELVITCRNAQDEAVAACEQHWQTKLADMRASMSADAVTLQAHWEGRVAEAMAAREAEFLRLMGEIGVLRGRLDKEITRRRDTEEILNNTRQQAAKCKKLWTSTEQKYEQMRREQKQIRSLAVKLLSITNPMEKEEYKDRHHNMSLADLMNRAISNASIIHARHCVNQKV
ncbi:hypothetical protein BX666DRAFT_1903957 [Dichotomocladium elegans]|nr:hypothetical protein BX666DRAFT_1903957 [Dichotomocladium elegans]